MYGDFYSDKDVEKALGPIQLRETVWDDPNLYYEIDMIDIVKAGGKYHILRASGCSCWGGEFSYESGPYETLDDLRAHVEAEYEPNYYKDVRKGFEDFFASQEA